MKILFANALYIPNIGGVENYIRSLAEVLTDSGNTVEIVTSDRVPTGAQQPEPEERREEALVYRYHYGRLPLSYPVSLFRAWRLVKRRCSDRKDFDHVVVRSHHAAIFCWLAGLRSVVYVAPGVYAYQYHHSNTWRRPKRFISYWLNVGLQRLAFKVSGEVVVLSSSMSDQVQKVSRGAVQSRIVPPGVDQQRFMPRSSDEKRKLRLALDLPENARLVLGLGRFASVKSFEIAVASLAHLPEDVHLVLVGEGPMKAAYVEMARGLSVSARLHIKPATALPEDYYAAADTFVLSSTHEAFGQVLLEATSTGLAVAAFSSRAGVCTATEELYRDFPSLVHWADESSPVALSGAIETSLSKPLESSGSYGDWQKFLQRYSWSGVAKNLLGLEVVLAQGSGEDRADRI